MKIFIRCALLVVLISAGVQAAPVTNWHTFKATPATILTGQGTDDPVVGGLGASETADASFVIGYLGTPVSLVNVGDQITFTFAVSFNDLTDMVNAGDNFRFALFDLNGEAQVVADNTATAGTDDTDDYRGYIFGLKNGTGTGSGGSIRERIAMLATGDNAFAATGTNATTAPSLGAVGGDPVTLTSDTNGDETGADYTGVMTLTLTGSGIDLSGSFIGTNSPTGNLFSASDNTSPSPATFGAVGFLIGDALNVEQVIFQDVSVTVVPEPSSVALFALGSVLLLRCRRRG